MLNYKAVPGGNSDPECTHVILTKEDYGKLVAQIAKAEREAAETHRQAAASIEKVKQEARTQLLKDREETQKIVDSLNAELEQERRDSDYLAGLNENLLRIARERANADRKLKRKKEHTGYIVVSSTEKPYRYKVDQRRWKVATLWETVLETPYSIDFTEEQAREQTEELIGNDGKGAWLVGQLGINASYSGEYENMLADKEWSLQQKRELNIMLKKRLRANYKTGYWEIIFSHTKPLGVVPEDMRAR